MSRPSTLILAFLAAIALSACGAPFGTYPNPPVVTPVVPAASLPPNSLIHPTSSALIAPTLATTPVAQPTSQPVNIETTQDPTATILSALSADGRFSTLLAALDSGNFSATLNVSTTVYTLFAPTDEAFAALPAETLAALQNNPADLRSILLYHKVAGQLTPAQITQLGSIGTLEGSSITVRVADGNIELNGGQARLIGPVIQTVNGFIYVIDGVLTPP